MIRALIAWWRERQHRQLWEAVEKRVGRVDERLMQEARELIEAKTKGGLALVAATHAVVGEFAERAGDHFLRGYTAHAMREIQVSNALLEGLKEDRRR